MRKLGYILLIFGFVWVTFVVVELPAFDRAIGRNCMEKISGQQAFTLHQVGVAVGEVSGHIEQFAALSFVGGLLMLAGGIILGRTSAAKKPPIV